MSEAAEDTKPVEAGQDKAVETPADETSVKTEGAAANTDDKKETTNSGNMLKTTAAQDEKNWGKNNKFDPSQQGVTDDPATIRKQVEFYFGDWNYPQDKFMWETCGGTENKPMPLATLHSFKRMRRFQPYSAVVAALRDSSLIQISGEEGKEEIKRKRAYQPLSDARSKNEAATVYVKGFGDETPTTQIDLEKFFGDFGEFKAVKLRRTNENLFKGSVFVTFPDVDTAKKYIAQDPQPKWNGHDLKIMSKQAYCDEKSELIRQGKLEPNLSVPKKFYEGKEGGKGAGRGGPRDRDDWKKRRDYDQRGGFRGGRGGGGRGRGGRGRGGRGRGGGFRGGDRNEERKNGGQNGNNAKPPQIQSSTESNGKRAREDDGGEAPVAKKVDVKES